MSATLPALALGPDVNLSGTFAASLSWYEDHTDTIDTTDVDLENNGSNFRITAAAQEVGIRAFMAYERGASNDRNENTGTGIEDVREFYAGVSGQYGTLVYGRKATDYRIAGERLDPFYNTSVASFNGLFASEGASYGQSNFTNGYQSNTVGYRSPVWGGFSGNLSAYINDNTNNQGVGDDADFGIGLSYANSDWLGLEAGVQALDINGNVVRPLGAPTGELDAYRLHATIGQKLWSFGLSYEMVDVALEQDPRAYAFISGTYQLTEALRLAATAGNVNKTPSTDGNGGSLGVFYDLTKNLTTYGAVRYVALDNAVNEDNFTVATGVKFTFDTDL